jgi:hypothetical protein
MQVCALESWLKFQFWKAIWKWGWCGWCGTEYTIVGGENLVKDLKVKILFLNQYK